MVVFLQYRYGDVARHHCVVPTLHLLRTTPRCAKHGRPVTVKLGACGSNTQYNTKNHLSRERHLMTVYRNEIEKVFMVFQSLCEK
jgi:hypothetical protein